MTVNLKVGLRISLLVIAALLVFVAGPTAPVAAAPETPAVAPATTLAAPPQESCAGQFHINPSKYYTIEVHVDETPAGTAVDGNGNPIVGDFPARTDQTKGTVPKGMWANFFRWDGYKAHLIGYAQVISCNMLGGDLEVFENDIWGQLGWKVYRFITLTVQTPQGWRDILVLKED